MKKSITKVLALILVCVLALFTLASCGGGLSGTYSAEVEVAGQTWEVSYTFSGDKVTAESKATILGVVQTKTATGTYTISDAADPHEITFSFDEDTILFKSSTYVLVQGEDYVQIGVVKYNKK